jgi:predicted dinucleotide-binding enzyme
MRVGILGSGLMGGKLGTLFARAGHEVVFSYARSHKRLEGLARDAGRNARAGAPGDAAEDADALLLAVHWSRMDDVLKQAGDLSGKVIVSCSLPMNADNIRSRRRPHLVGRGGTCKNASEGSGRLCIQHCAQRSARVVRKLPSSRQLDGKRPLLADICCA